MGFDKDPIAVSSVHGTGSGDLLDAVLEALPEDADFDDEDDDSIKVAVIGKPNAGKSSIINRFIGEERLIVSNIAGTTRDAVDTKVENEYGKFTFIDIQISLIFVPLYYFMYSILAVCKMSCIMWPVSFACKYFSLCVFCLILREVCGFSPPTT